MHRTHRIANSLLKLTAAAAALALASLLLAACGGSSSSTTTNGSAPSATASAPAASATSPARTTSTTAKAPNAKGGSASKNPSARVPARPAAGNAAHSLLRNAAFKAALTKFAECMRSHKVDLPNPNTSGHGPIFKRGAVNPSTPQFRAAQVACLSVLRSALPGLAHAGAGAKAKR